MQLRLRWVLVGLIVSTSALTPIACRGPETLDGAGGQSGDEGVRLRVPALQRPNSGDPALPG